MYVMVWHQIANPEGFWKKAVELLETMPSEVTLHHTFSTADGAHAVCIWEAAEIETVRNVLAPKFAGMSIDTYMMANNKEGVVGPPQFMPEPAAV